VFAFLLSKVALQLLSAIIGGYGIFFLILSFDQPDLAAHAFVLLAAAAAMVYFAPSDRTRL
jgi:multisubunit Na+/H+ antiporter MnhB subunit